MTKQAIIYTRFSPRPNAAECDSCEKQAERCYAYCERKGHEASGAWLADEAISGGILDRPGLSEAIRRLEPGYILVVDSNDRLARDILVSLTIRQQVADAGATIEFADGSLCENTPEGKLFQNVLAAFSAYERDRIRLRTKNGLKKKRKNRERTTSKIPIGWQLDPDNPKLLIRHHGERKAILRICRYKAEGMTSATIARRLDMHIGYCRGKPWSARTVRKMIKKHFFWACPVTGDPSLEPMHP